MRMALIMALAGAALLPAPAPAAGMQALIVHLDPVPAPARDVPARAVAGQLERDGRRAQAPLLAELATLQRAGHVRHVRSLWIAGAVAVSADATAIGILRARPDVRSIERDSVLALQPADAVTGEPGVASAGAPELWSHGIDGRGVTVAALDTGVDLTHAALAGRYRGGADSWFDPYGQHSAPVDLDGHGTEVMGVMVAGDGMGMAPGARFIAARVFDDSGVSTDSAVHMAFQWLLDPDGNPATDDAPDVVNASWGAQLDTCDTSFEPDLQALRAAHILPVFAAGNAGQVAGSDTSPGNLPEAFAVGATATATTIASFSSIGPSRCGGGQFPALVAPGTGIRSTGRFGLDSTGLAGTSFSAPHAAGALALLLQVAPQLTADQQATRAIVKDAQDNLRDAQAKIALARKSSRRIATQQAALEALYRELSPSRDEWALTEVEQVLMLASQQLQFAGNVRGALAALQVADTKLQRLDRPQFVPLRRALARDMDRLKAVPYVDVAGLSLRLDEAIGQIDALPMALDGRLDASPPPASPQGETGWRRLLNDAWQEIRQLIRIEKRRSSRAAVAAA